jgi:Tfp pilus assembly protein PilF
MKKFLLGLCLFLFAACASDEHISESENVVSDTEEVKVKPAPVISQSKGNSENNIIEAIKSANEENVYKAATLALSQNTNDLKALSALGMYHYRKGHPLLSQYFFNKALSLKPKSSDLHNNMGLTYLALREERQAIRSFRKALELNPMDINAAANVGAIYLRQRDFAKAFMVMDPAFRRGVRDIKMLNNYAIASSWMGKVKQAESLYGDALKTAPTNKEVIFNYAAFLISQQGKMKEGLEQITKLKQLGLVENMKNQVIALENKAKAGLK